MAGAKRRRRRRGAAGCRSRLVVPSVAAGPRPLPHPAAPCRGGGAPAPPPPRCRHRQCCATSRLCGVRQWRYPPAAAARRRRQPRRSDRASWTFRPSDRTGTGGRSEPRGADVPSRHSHLQPIPANAKGSTTAKFSHSISKCLLFTFCVNFYGATSENYLSLSPLASFPIRIFFFLRT